MREALELTGVVLKTQPIREYDKRLVLLTGERGRITAFSRGSRRPTSPLLAATNPFVFGTFTLYEGKEAYTLVNVSAADYFDGLAHNLPGVYYGFYFLELLQYFIQEGEEASEAVNLLYVALKAIQKDLMPLPLIRRVFEIRLLVISGLYAPPEERGTLDESAYYALGFVASASLKKLFSFTLSESAMADFVEEADRRMARVTDAEFKSLELIDEGF